MDPISNVDRVAALLQQKLRERSRAGSAKSSKSGDKTGQPLTGLDGARAIAAMEGVNDRQRRRVFLHNILAEQFDPALVNDAQFQHLVTRVAQAIEDDSDSAASLSQLLTDLARD